MNVCPHCSEVCKTPRGVTQHIGWSKSCREAQRSEMEVRQPSEDPVAYDDGMRTSKRMRRGEKQQEATEKPHREGSGNSGSLDTKTDT